MVVTAIVVAAITPPALRLLGMFFARSILWNDERDRAFVEGVMVRVFQLDKHFVRTGRETHEDDWVSTRICPHPRGIIDSHVQVSDSRRDRQGIGAEHRRNVEVLSTILDDGHSP